MAAKDNITPSQIDKTSFFWAQLCGICHPGGGATEYDRDGLKLWDAETGMFGYELLGKTETDVALDGDYSVLSSMDGSIKNAPWHVTGVTEPDCLMCHRSERTVVDGKNMNWIWRAGTLRGSSALVNSAGDSVPAFAASSTAGQGWFSNFELAMTPPGKPPLATTLQIDYSGGIADGSLLEDIDMSLSLAGTSVINEPRDLACWGCHATADLKKRARSWFEPATDVHYAAFNNLTDADPANDIAMTESQACTRCHEAGIDHNITKGNVFLGSVQDETDHLNFRDCAGCHLESSPDRDPEAPMPTSSIHFVADSHLEVLSCQACHIPYRDRDAQLIVDNAVTGSSIGYNTSAFLSADPLDPTNPDKTRWYPSFKYRTDANGVSKLYPNKLLLSVWWGSWDQNGTPGDTTDDVIAPIALWRLRGLTGAAPLPGVSDDNGDGIMEVNTLDEISIYIQALKNPDRYGNPLALNPVLVKGGRVYFEDLAEPFGVGSLDYEEAGIHTESSHPFSLDHNVFASSEALGANDCSECHGAGSAMFDRLILVDPYDENGDPVYKTVREITGLSPF